MLDSAMQRQQQQESKGGGGLPYENRRTAAATPRENERSTATVSQSQQQSLAAALRELRMHRSSSSSYAEDKDVKRTKTKRQSRKTNSHISHREAVLECDGQSFRRLSFNAANAAALYLEASGSSRHHGHFEQLPFGSRDQAKAKAESSSASASQWDHKRHDADSAPPPPPLPFAFVKDMLRCVRRSHPLKRQNIFSKGMGINLNDLKPPPRRRMSLGTQSSESDPFASLQRLASRPRNHGRSAEDAATVQLRKMCRDIVQSAEQGTSPPPRAQIKKVLIEYHLSRNNPISPRDPNFTEIPPEFSQILTYGIARSQTQTVQQSTNDPNTNYTRRSRSRFSESYATKKILGD